MKQGYTDVDPHKREFEDEVRYGDYELAKAKKRKTPRLVIDGVVYDIPDDA